MKIHKAVPVFLVLLLAAAGYAQEMQEKTEDLGMGVFANERGPILLAVDAAMVDFQMKSPYVMFVLYMASKNPNQDIVVGRDTIEMIYEGKEYKMPSLKELRDDYSGAVRDVDFYRHLGKEGVIASWVRFYNFPQRADFFPPLTMRGTLAVDQASMYSFTGFRTKVYFKNPGFKKGDKLTFKVWDKKDTSLAGTVHVVLD